MPTPQPSLTWRQTLIICAGVLFFGVLTIAGICFIVLRSQRHFHGWEVAATALTGVVAMLTFAVLMNLHFITKRYQKERPMSAITGTEPAHWHDADGRHRMRDPRKIPGWVWKDKSGNWSDADERAYVQHLIDHEPPAPERAMDPVEPRPGDPETALTIIAAIGVTQQMLAKYHELLAAVRSHHHITTVERKERPDEAR